MDGYSGYYPVGHEPGGNFDRNMVVGWLREELRKADKVIFANALYDLGWLGRDCGIELDAERVVDVQYLVALLDEYRYSYALDDIAKDYLGEGKKTDVLKTAARAFGFDSKKDNPVANLWRLAPQYAGEYGQTDAQRTLDLFPVLWKKIEEEDLVAASQLEHGLIPILLDMRRRGVRVDLERAALTRKMLLDEYAATRQKIKSDTGLWVEPWSGTSVEKVLAVDGIVCPRTPKTNQPSIKKEFLKDVAAKSPLAFKILRLRKISKMGDTFIQSSIIDNHWMGRIHAQFHPLRSEDGGTVTYRFSSSDPNLQQVPARDEEFARLIRGIFLPEEGEYWAACDYSSQEPRLTVHFAEASNVRGGKAAGDLYRAFPRTDYHQMVADMCGIPRSPAKIINLGLSYGMGEPKLCHSLGYPTEWIERWDGNGLIEVAGPEGKELLEKYHTNAPFIGGLMKKVGQRARDRGFVRLLLGHRGRFPQDKGFKVPFHKAVNKLIQGSAAEQTKAAMIALWKEGFRNILVQVHDELGLSVVDGEQALKAKRIMEQCVQLLVPTVVDVEMGRSWGDPEFCPVD